MLWAGVHGITSLSTADKLSVVTTETAGRLIDDLVGTYLAGLRARRQPGARAQAVLAPSGSAAGAGDAPCSPSRWAMALA